MRLRELLRSAGLTDGPFSSDPEILSVVADSRAVTPGALFVAVPGREHDGHSFLHDALRSGAVAAVVQRPTELPVPTVLVPDSRLTLSRLAAALNGFPAKRLVTVGVTGTDGKTTTCFIIAHLLCLAGLPSGAVTTVGTLQNGVFSPSTGRQTTPEAWEIQSILAGFESNGVQAAVVESTSHGLAQHRVADCEYDVAVFTNVTHEHLDYHGTLEQYRRDKARLIELTNRSCKPSWRKAVVLNLDDPLFHYYRGWSLVPVISYSAERSAQVVATDISADLRGSSFVLHHRDKRLPARLSLPGTYNVRNALAAASAALAIGIPPEVVAENLASVPQVPGRMQRIDAGQPFAVIVDYAHTPEAFRQVLPMFRGLTSGRIICVFGSAGQRDRAKRSLQGELAGQYCDLVVLTDEDPRTEDRWLILREIAVGAARAGKREGDDLLLIPDRREAIATALRLAKPGDAVLLLGKGHELSIEYADGPTPWDEARVAREELLAMGYGKE